MSAIWKAAIANGPDGHPIPTITIKWREDGSVDVMARPGPIAVSGMDLRDRKNAWIRIVPHN